MKKWISISLMCLAVGTTYVAYEIRKLQVISDDFYDCNELSVIESMDKRRSPSTQASSDPQQYLRDLDAVTLHCMLVRGRVPKEPVSVSCTRSLIPNCFSS